MHDCDQAPQFPQMPISDDTTIEAAKKAILDKGTIIRPQIEPVMVQVPAH